MQVQKFLSFSVFVSDLSVTHSFIKSKRRIFKKEWTAWALCEIGMASLTEKANEEQIKKNLLEAKRNAFSAIEYGKATLEALDQQDEIIQEVEDTLQANEYTIQRSFKALRGMTWSGYIANKCSDVRSTFVTDSSNNPTKVSSVKVGGHSSASSSSGTANPNALFDSNRSSCVQSADDQDLNDISSAVDVLHRMGLTLGEQLDSQKVTLERIEDKTSQVTDQTLAVTLRASQLLRKNNRPIQSFVGTFQFVDVDSGRFMCVSETDGSSIAFRPLPDLSSHFHVFVKENNLFGLLNEKTQKYLGCTIWGTVAVLGQYFGTQEECYLDLSALVPGATGSALPSKPIAKGAAAVGAAADPTGLLFLARHWGSGGWLKLDRSALSAEQSAAEEWLTGDTTAAITDRLGAVILRPVRSRVDPQLQQQQQQNG